MAALDFHEWACRHGIESARKQFRLGDHMVFVVRPGKNVFATCGQWKGSQPLGINPDIEHAKQVLRDAVQNCFDSEETIYETAKT